MSRIGELAAGRPFDPVAEQAVAAVERATGASIARTGRESSGELSNILLVADLVAVLCSGCGRPARTSTRESLVARDRAIESMPSASGGRLTFGPGEHWGCREMRGIEWRSGAWRVVSDYAPIVAASS